MQITLGTKKSELITIRSAEGSDFLKKIVEYRRISTCEIIHAKRIFRGKKIRAKRVFNFHLKSDFVKRILYFIVLLYILILYHVQNIS